MQSSDNRGAALFIRVFGCEQLAQLRRRERVQHAITDAKNWLASRDARVVRRKTGAVS
jgi:hypothetical protein